MRMSQGHGMPCPPRNQRQKTMTPQEIQAALEAIIYAADEPATLDQIAKALGIEKPEARAALEQLTAAYQTEDRGIEVRKVAGGWKFYTKAQHHDVVRKFIKSLQPPLRLTMPALETLAVIAYKQPATVPEINEIRGVHVGGVIKDSSREAPDHHRRPQGSNRPPHPLPHLQTIHDALRPLRPGRAPQPERIRSPGPSSPGLRRRHRRNLARRSRAE